MHKVSCLFAGGEEGALVCSYSLFSFAFTEEKPSLPATPWELLAIRAQWAHLWLIYSLDHGTKPMRQVEAAWVTQLWRETLQTTTLCSFQGGRGKQFFLHLALFFFLPHFFALLLFLFLRFHPSSFLHLLVCLSFYTKHLHSFSFLKRNKLKWKPKGIF